MKKTDKTITLFDLKLFGRDKSSLLAKIGSKLGHSSKLSYIFTPNPEQVVLSYHHKGFKTALQQAEILIADGAGLVLASNLLKLAGKIQEPLLSKIPGREVVKELINLAAEHNYKILVVGGRGYEGKSIFLNQERENPVEVRISEVGKGTGEDINPHHKTYPIWWTSAYSQVTKPSAAEEKAVIQAIERYQPDIICVALGAPHQELWLTEHRELLEKQGVTIGMAVGGSFDSILGIVPGVPAWVSAIGMEWLFRLITQPWRWRRQLRLVEFGWRVLLEMLK